MAPLRCCLLSGGESRRMGRDKALLPHPEGGTWLERSLRLLGELEQPITVFSRHGVHLERAEALARDRGLDLRAIEEPPPWEGPLRALERLMALYPQQRLLLCPVDLPWLDATSLRALIAAADRSTDCAADRNADATLHLAHDGRFLQPLLGVYPTPAARLTRLQAALAAGERGVQRWLAGEAWRPVALPAAALRNGNRPSDLDIGPSGRTG